MTRLLVKQITYSRPWIHPRIPGPLHLWLLDHRVPVNFLRDLALEALPRQRLDEVTIAIRLQYAFFHPLKRQRQRNERNVASLGVVPEAARSG